MDVIFSSPKDIVLHPEQKITLDKLTILQMTDFPERKVVRVNTVEIGTIVVFQGAEYDAIGQWTDTDVVNKIKSMYP